MGTPASATNRVARVARVWVLPVPALASMAERPTGSGPVGSNGWRPALTEGPRWSRSTWRPWCPTGSRRIEGHGRSRAQRGRRDEGAAT